MAISENLVVNPSRNTGFILKNRVMDRKKSLLNHQKCWFKRFFKPILPIAVVTVILPVQGLKDKNSPYDVPQWQVDQFDKVREFAKIGKKH